MQSMTIGKLAKAVGLGVETVRFYEREGLIPSPPRRVGEGYRKYGPDVAQRLKFIRRAKSLGFSLREIKELLSLRVRVAAKGASVKAKVQVKINDIEQKISELQAIKAALEQLNALCSGEASTSECPILDTLYQDEIKQWEALKPCCQKKSHLS